METKKFYTGKAFSFACAAVLFIVLFYAFNSFIYHEKQEGAHIVPEPSQITLCFIRNTEDGGSANIVMNIAGENVTGSFDWKPAEKDKKTGPFSGKILAVDKMSMSRTLDVIWNASAEGKTAPEQLKIVMGEGNAAPGFGEMKMRNDGVYVYADPSKIVYEPTLSDVGCDM